MKKLMLIGAVAVLGLSSCKKERTCTCTDKNSSAKEETTVEAKKKDATIACEGAETTYVSYKSTDEDGNVYEATAEEIAEWNKEEDSDWTCTLD